MMMTAYLSSAAYSKHLHDVFMVHLGGLQLTLKGLPSPSTPAPFLPLHHLNGHLIPLPLAPLPNTNLFVPRPSFSNLSLLGVLQHMPCSMLGEGMRLERYKEELLL